MQGDQSGTVAAAASLFDRLDRGTPVSFQSWAAAVRTSGRLAAIAELDLGKACVRRNDEGEAVAHFRSAHAADPTCIQAMRSLIACLWALGERREAKDVVCEYLYRVPDDAEYWRFLGSTQMELGDTYSAAASLERAVSLEPHVVALEQLACCYLRLHHPLEAIRACDQAIALGPPSTFQQGYLGKGRFDLGDYATAVVALEEAVRLDASCREWWMWLLAATALGKDRECAQTVVDRLEQGVPSPAQTICDAGVLVAGRGAFEQSVNLYRQAIVLDSQHVQARVRLAEALSALGKFDEAESIGRELNRIAPESLEGERVMANVCMATRRFREAADYYDRVSTHALGDSTLLFLLGVAQAKAGDRDGSFRTLKRLEEIDPERAALLREQLQR